MSRHSCTLKTSLAAIPPISKSRDLGPVPAQKLTAWILGEGLDAGLDLVCIFAPHVALKAGRANANIDDVASAPAGWKEIARRLRIRTSNPGRSCNSGQGLIAHVSVPCAVPLVVEREFVTPARPANVRSAALWHSTARDV